MAKVLEFTARRHCPAWDIHVDCVNAMAGNAELNRSGNALKLKAWAERVYAAPDGAQLVLMDTDMYIQSPLDEIWERPFDVAFTQHLPERKRIPFNGGICFMRVSDPVRAFFRAWQEMSARMVKDRKLHKMYHAVYAGQNQAALGALIEMEAPEFTALNWLWLSGGIWNCADSEWFTHWDTDAKIVHVKGAYRQELFGYGSLPARPKSAFKPLVAHWLALEAEANHLP